jgi:hypothetical protein
MVGSGYRLVLSIEGSEGTFTYSAYDVAYTQSYQYIPFRSEPLFLSCVCSAISSYVRQELRSINSKPEGLSYSLSKQTL